MKAAALAADLPDGVWVVSAQTVDDSDTPNLDAVVRLCSEGLSEAELRSAATAVALAIEPAQRPELSRLIVSSWVPSGQYIDQEGSASVQDYEIYLWAGDFADGIDPDDRWDVRI